MNSNIKLKKNNTIKIEVNYSVGENLRKRDNIYKFNK